MRGTSPSGSRRRRTLVAGLLALLFAACGGTASERASAEGVLRGVELAPAPRAEFTLTDTSGQPFHFRQDTEGHVALLFFGYTHCPDICPVHMANIASVLRDLPWEIRDRVKVVFVTTDPERDTPERLAEWLANFDPEFVGLTGDLAEINRIQNDLGLPAAVRLDEQGNPTTESTGGAGDPADEEYLVGHASQVIAFGLDDRTRFAYPHGIRQADWEHDLPRLVGTARPAGRPAVDPGAAAP